MPLLSQASGTNFIVGRTFEFVYRGPSLHRVCPMIRPLELLTHGVPLGGDHSCEATERRPFDTEEVARTAYELELEFAAMRSQID